MSKNYLTNKNLSPPFEAFLKSVALFPDNNALYINDNYYTYRKLYDISIDIFLSIDSKKKYKRIGVYCYQDVNTYAAILAVGCYGAAYVPLHTSWPHDRLNKIIAACELELILSSGEIPEGVIVKKWQMMNVSVHQRTDVLMSMPEALVETEECYVLFTSGTTGTPKGVPVTKNNLQAFFNFFLQNYSFTANDRFLQAYELTFDVSVFSVFMPWYVGACTYVVAEGGVKFISIVKMLKEQQITVASTVPGILVYAEKYLDQIKLPHLRYSFFSGDCLYHHLAVKWKKCLPNGAIHNFYGPTETTIVCTRYEWEEQPSQLESYQNIVPLGISFPEMEWCIINEQDEEVPRGQKGNLCFSGAQVIKQYLNRKDEQAFIQIRDKRFYKTGDWVFQNEQGNLVFCGRKDEQVKINGYRIEIKEIEQNIKQITGANCCVIDWEEPSKNRYLVVIIDKRVDFEKLLTELRFFLPEYMLPKKILYLASMPFSLNGKTDKQQIRKLYESQQNT